MMARKSAKHIDEAYVQEILDAARPGMTRDQFAAHCRLDRNAGWPDEADEAERRYFNEGSHG